MTGLVLALYLAVASCVGIEAGAEPEPPRIRIIHTKDGLVPCKWHPARRCHGKYVVGWGHRTVVVSYGSMDAVLAHEFVHHLLRFKVGRYDKNHRRPEWRCQNLRMGELNGDTDIQD